MEDIEITPRDRAAAVSLLGWFAVWKDGARWIGSPERRFRDVAAEVLAGKYDGEIAAGIELGGDV